MVDFANANLCGASPELNDVLSKLEDAKADITAKLDASASAASAAFGEAKNELEGLKNKLQTIEIPAIPKLNLQAEIASLTSLVPGTPSFLSALAKIKLEFEDDIKGAGLDLGTLVADATAAISGGDSLCAIIPNLEKVSGSIDAAVEKPAAVKQAAAKAVSESPSNVTQDSAVEETVAALKKKTIDYVVTSTPPTKDTGAIKVASENDAQTLSNVNGELIKVILPGSSKNFSGDAGFSHRNNAGVLDNYDPDIKPVPDFVPATGLLTYKNSNATRRLKLVPALESILISAAAATGINVVVFSGGQNRSTGTVGSKRHDDGFAADIWLYKDGRRLSMVKDVALASSFAKAAKDAGALSIGAGSGYMNDVGMHVDISQSGPLRGSGATYWGAGGKSANAAPWLSSIMVG